MSFVLHFFTSYWFAIKLKACRFLEMIEHGIAPTHAPHAYSCIHNRYSETKIIIQTWYFIHNYNLDFLLLHVQRSVLD